MKTIFILFDSLNRSALSCYGGSVPTPNFDRLAQRSAIFDTHFAGSLPCMPARRDMQTGRLNFLHRSWGPGEPFDRCFPDQVKKSGIYSHLVTDHYHYFEDGGATYHTRYSSWEFIRGQESDPYIAMVTPPLQHFKDSYHPVQFEDNRDGHRLQGMINRTAIRSEGDYPVVKCIDRAIDFLENNAEQDNWCLQVETFDPHEPFDAPDEFQDNDTGYTGRILDWPRYRQLEETEEEIAELRARYAALVRFCDAQLGRLLDEIDARNLWQDTAIILTTDHGFLLGEHNWWAKNRMPFYNEVAHIPLMIYHPAQQIAGGSHISALTQTIDIMPTLLEIFSLPIPDTVTGYSLLPYLLNTETTPRHIALYGIFGGAINATDGQYSYFRYPEDMEQHPLNEYTLMPMHNRSLFEIRELVPAELYYGFSFTKGVPVLKIPALKDAKRSPRQGGFADTQTRLFDMRSDAGQNAPFRNKEIEAEMLKTMATEMAIHEAPDELYHRFDIGRPT